MEPIKIETKEKSYPVPSLDYDVLCVTAGDSKSSSERGMVTEVEVPEGGVLLEFLTGGGKVVAPPIHVVPAQQPKHEPKQSVPSESKRRPEKSKPDDVQPVERKPEDDGSPVSGPVQLETPSVGEGDSGLKG